MTEFLSLSLNKYFLIQTIYEMTGLREENMDQLTTDDLLAMLEVIVVQDLYMQLGWEYDGPSDMDDDESTFG